MSIAGWKVTLNSYFDFNFGIAFAICLVIFGIYLHLKKRQKSQGQSVSKKEIFCGLALSIYLALLIGGTLLNRGIGDEYQMRLIPFWSYWELILNGERALLIQIVINVLIFIPWGILFPMASTKMQKFRWNIVSALLFSIMIEVIQLIFKCGLFEFDDMFHNTLGAVIGYGAWRGIVMWKTRKKVQDCEFPKEKHK